MDYKTHPASHCNNTDERNLPEMRSHETAYVWTIRLASLHIAILMKEICQK